MKYALLLCAALTVFACDDNNDTSGASSTWCDRHDGPSDSIAYSDTTTDVCYAPIDDGSATKVIDNGGDLNVPQTANGTTVVFDEDTNGKPIVGDVTLDGNNVTVYGNGAGETIIDGDVVIAGNNARIRGVTITGNLTVSLNNAAIVACRIEGNVIVSKNNTLFARNDVFGSLESSSNNNVFIDNRVRGAWSIRGNNTTCDENQAFADQDSDGIVDDDETGAALSCG